ncbi:MAG: Gfo/Idh/MocA family oxidoreductase [Polaromonas sp.]|nr:Gfo/Idh/MocA family oxidoreductase [Polaromonas sp.]
MSLRVLMTGAGSIAKRHANNLLASLPDAEVIVVTRDPAQRLLSWPAGVQSVASFEQGLAANPDAVMICSVSASHAQELLKVLELGLPVFVEKPLLTSLADLQRIEALLATTHPACVVGCNLRFLPSLRRLRQALQDGLIGTVVRAHLEVGQWLPDWRPGRALESSYSADAGAGGGVVFDLVHEIDAAVWLLGDLTLVSAVGGHLSSLPIRAPDTAVALLRAASGHPVTVSLDYISRKPVRRYVFVGEGGTLIWDMQAGRLSLMTAKDEQVLADSATDFLMATTYVDELAEWLAAIKTSTRAATCPLQTALPTARLMLDIAAGLS